MSGTLLGPEGSAAVMSRGVLLASLVGVVPVWAVSGLVGLLFEICIVDASILCDAASGGVDPRGACVVVSL